MRIQTFPSLPALLALVLCCVAPASLAQTTTARGSPKSSSATEDQETATTPTADVVKKDGDKRNEPETEKSKSKDDKNGDKEKDAAELAPPPAPTLSIPAFGALPEETPATKPAPVPANPVPATPAKPAIPTQPAPTKAPLPAAPVAVQSQPKSKPKSKPKLKRLLVMDLVDKGAGPDITRALSETIAAQALRSFAGSVVTSSQIRLTLDAAGQQAMLGCESERCMTDLATTIEATEVLGGSVAKVGDDLLITVLKVDARTGQGAGTAQRKTPLHQDLYFYAAQQLTAIALTGVAMDTSVPLRISVDVNGAKVIVDGKEVGQGETTVRVSPGDHEVLIRADGYVQWRSVIPVAATTPVEVRANLIETSISLWPAAATSIGIGAVALTGGVLLGLYSYDNYAGTLGFVKKGDTYLHAAPVDSQILASKKQLIGQLALGANILYVAGGVLVAGGAVVGVVDMLME